MAIKFNHRGKVFTADTPEEAVKLQRLLEDADSQRAKTDPEFGDKLHKELAGWTEDKFWDVYNSLGLRQTQLLRIIFNHTCLRHESLLAGLDLPSLESLAGVVSGLSKQLTKCGVKLGDVLIMETHWIGKKKDRFFSLTPGFEAAMRGIGYWKLKKWDKEASARIDKVHKRIMKKEEKLDIEIFGS
jgi:hypothetical protein